MQTVSHARPQPQPSPPSRARRSTPVGERLITPAEARPAARRPPLSRVRERGGGEGHFNGTLRSSSDCSSASTFGVGSCVLIIFIAALVTSVAKSL